MFHVTGSLIFPDTVDIDFVLFLTGKIPTLLGWKILKNSETYTQIIMEVNNKV